MKTSGTLVLVILAGSVAYAQTPGGVSINVIPVPPVSGTAVGRLQGINKSNQAVGYTVGGDEAEGFIYSNGSKTPIEIQRGVGVQVYGIENNGRAVGKYYEYEPVTKAVIKTHGFMYFHGDITNIDYPGMNITVARGINDPQRVVGYYIDGNGRNHGFFFDKKDYTTIDITSPMALGTRVLGINNPGDMVGYYTLLDSNGDLRKHGFLYDKKGNVTTIDVQIPGVTVTDTVCYGINSSGVIVGSYVDDSGNTHGFVQLNGVFQPVDAPNVPPGVGTFVQGINDNGAITVFSTVAFVGNVVGAAVGTVTP
jgi:uncharacterized membrane protein